MSVRIDGGSRPERGRAGQKGGVGHWRGVAAGLLVAVTCSLGCSGGGDSSSSGDQRTGTSIVDGMDAVGSIAASPQHGDGRTVLVDRVVFPSDSAGFVAVYADGNGAPGRLLGVSDKFTAGPKEGVRIALDQAVTGSAPVHLVLHDDDDGDGKFGAPDHDRALTTASGVVSVVIDYKLDP